MCDETTDVAVVKEVIIYARYLGSDRKVCTSFIGMMEVSIGTARKFWVHFNNSAFESSLILTISLQLLAVMGQQ